MPRANGLIVIIVVALSACAFTQEDHPSVSKIKKHIYDSDYSSWTEPYRDMPLLSYWFDPGTGKGGTDPAILKVVVVDGDDEPLNPKAFGNPIRLYGSSVSIDGRLCSFLASAFGFEGGGATRLPDDVISQLKELAASLPDDHKQLPPKGRRVVVETMYTPKVQVYDRANLPAEITTILRLTGITLHPLLDKSEVVEQPDKNH